MKIYVVIAKVELIKKPEWLDDFRAKYDEPFEPHITLKQPAFIEESEAEEIDERLKVVLADYTSPLTIRFDKLHPDPGSSDNACIMIDSDKNGGIADLQKKIAKALASYSNYYKPYYREYEINFQPHITIARDLDKPRYQEALQTLDRDYSCVGQVNEIKLIVVQNFGPTEANMPSNQTIYHLGL